MIGGWCADLRVSLFYKQDLLLEDYDSESALNNMKQDFSKDKKAEKVWKSVKM